MKDFTSFKIVRFDYPFPTEELTKRIWDKMDSTETKWAIQLTIKGINDTGDSEEGSWDIFFLDNKLEEKIEQILQKYDVPFKIIDQTQDLKNPEKFTEDFLKKLDDYLFNNLTIDDVLDRILEVGLENITIFEKYFLSKNTENQ